MTKREAFSAAVCLTGIWQIITALSRLASLGLIATQGVEVQTRAVVVVSVLVTALELAAGLVLVFASRQIAAAMVPSDGPLDLAGSNGLPRQMISLYSKLLGLLVSITGALSLVGAVLASLAWSPSTSAGPIGSRVLASVAQIVVGLALIGCSAAVARALSGKQYSEAAEGSEGAEG